MTAIMGLTPTQNEQIRVSSFKMFERKRIPQKLHHCGTVKITKGLLDLTMKYKDMTHCITYI